VNKFLNFLGGVSIYLGTRDFLKTGGTFSIKRGKNAGPGEDKGKTTNPNKCS